MQTSGKKGTSRLRCSPLSTTRTSTTADWRMHYVHCTMWFSSHKQMWRVVGRSTAVLRNSERSTESEASTKTQPDSLDLSLEPSRSSQARGCVSRKAIPRCPFGSGPSAGATPGPSSSWSPPPPTGIAAAYNGRQSPPPHGSKCPTLPLHPRAPSKWCKRRTVSRLL